MVKSYKYFLVAVFWAAIIFMLSTNSPLEAGPDDWYDFIGIDKVGHLVFYAIFCCLLCFAFYKMDKLNPRLILSIAIVFVYGVVMEFLQYNFYPDRYLEYSDMIANLIGALSGAFIFSKILQPRLKNL